MLSEDYRKDNALAALYFYKLLKSEGYIDLFRLAKLIIS